MLVPTDPENIRNALRSNKVAVSGLADGMLDKIPLDELEQQDSIASRFWYSYF